MLMNLRNALMAGKRLPYDNEIEFLESTGTQWITIPITLESTDTIGVTFTPRSSSSNGAIYCSSFGNQGNLLRRDTSGNLSVFSNGGSNAVSSYVAGTEYTVVWGNRQVSVNGTPTTVPYNVYLVVSPETSISLFATATGARSGYCAISHFYVEGKLDLIPVRKGTVGAMYDRRSVGGMNPDGSPRNDGMYFNRGTGDFVLGPDVVPVEWLESSGTQLTKGDTHNVRLEARF